MTTGYTIKDPTAAHFLTFTVVDWVDVFTRPRYCDIIIESLKYCRENKGLKIWGYTIMSNHMHSILGAENGNLPDVLRDFKRHTASKILKSIREEPESRRDWMLKRFEFAARSNVRNGQYQFWQHDNHAEEIISEKFRRDFFRKINFHDTRTSVNRRST
jgi:REP element-mobilizing transposase RayT